MPTLQAKEMMHNQNMQSVFLEGVPMLSSDAGTKYMYIIIET